MALGHSALSSAMFECQNAYLEPFLALRFGFFAAWLIPTLSLLVLYWSVASQFLRKPKMMGKIPDIGA